MKRLRWYDYFTINLFWLGLNIRNTALGSIFMPFLVGVTAPLHAMAGADHTSLLAHCSIYSSWRRLLYPGIIGPC